MKGQRECNKIAGKRWTAIVSQHETRFFFFTKSNLYAEISQASAIKKTDMQVIGKVPHLQAVGPPYSFHNIYHQICISKHTYKK